MTAWYVRLDVRGWAYVTVEADDAEAALAKAGEEGCELEDVRELYDFEPREAELL